MDPTPESEFGAPLLPAQTAMACARMTEDASGDLVVEYLVLPNMFIVLHPYANGTKVGKSHLISVPVARDFVEALVKRCEHVTECDCRNHDGMTMELADLSENL